MQGDHGMKIHTRSGGAEVEKPFEKPMVLPQEADMDPARHAWADARFATDIMSEHAFFFALLMPPEVAQEERTHALQFTSSFAELHKRIADAPPPDRGDVGRFTAEVIEAMKPLIEYKATLGDAQRNGTLRSLVWPLFFDHTLKEADRWTRRLEQLGQGESEFDKEEVAGFWNNIMDEHAGSSRTSSTQMSSNSSRKRLKRASCSGSWAPGASEGRPPHSSQNPAPSRAH